jgi:hypothetical protein
LAPFSEFRELIVSPLKCLQKRALFAEAVRSPRMKLDICKRLKKLTIREKKHIVSGRRKDVNDFSRI